MFDHPSASSNEHQSHENEELSNDNTFLDLTNAEEDSRDSTASNAEPLETNEEYESNEEYLEEDFSSVIEVTDDVIYEQEESFIEVKQEPNTSDGGNFECLYCDKTFVSRSGRDTHKQLKHKIPEEFDAGEIAFHEIELELSSGELVRAWKCPLCGQESRRKNHHQTHLIRHAIREKEENIKYESEETNIVISNSQTLRFVGPTSLESQVSSQGLKTDNRQMAASIPPPDKKMKVSNVCVLNNKLDDGSVVYSCSSCKSVYKDRNLASAHVSKFGALGMCAINNCAECSVVFPNEKLFKRHQKYHELEAIQMKYFECLPCSVMYKSVQDLANHLKQHTNPDFQFTPEMTTQLEGCEFVVKDLQAVPSATDFYCGHCAKFGPRDFINFHMTLFHASLICPFDYQNFSRSLGYFYDHMRVKHPQKFNFEIFFVCTTENCEERFASKSLMSEHSKTCIKKKFPCSHCEMRFSLERQLKHHMALVDGIKKFKCEYCGKGFVTKTELSVHVRSHTNTKPYKCPFPDCGKTFRTNSHRSAHMDWHNPEKTFKCQHCPNMFQTRGARRIHEKTHDVIFMNSCVLCHKDFSQRSHYVRHVNSVHHITCNSGNLEQLVNNYSKKIQQTELSENDQ